MMMNIGTCLSCIGQSVFIKHTDLRLVFKCGLSLNVSIFVSKMHADHVHTSTFSLGPIKTAHFCPLNGRLKHAIRLNCSQDLNISVKLCSKSITR